jgi:hypothetical protein
MSGSIRLVRRAVRQVGMPVVDLPVFLCPQILRVPAFQSQGPRRPRQHRFQSSQRRHITSITSTSVAASPKVLAPLLEKLPQQCPGCGALSQTADHNAPGFFTPTRKSIRKYLEGGSSSRKSAEDEIVKVALENAASVGKGISVGNTSIPGKKSAFVARRSY